jgi:hypothetical protein
MAIAQAAAENDLHNRCLALAKPDQGREKSAKAKLSDANLLCKVSEIFSGCVKSGATLTL